MDVISAFSSDGRINANDLVVLEDPRRAIAPYDALLLIAPRRADDAAFKASLLPLVGAVSLPAIRRASEMVEQNGAPIPEAARALDKMTASVGDASP
ncbi:MAG: glycine betaine ABC transporter substrate-binding protein [Methylocystis silviterrae]|uniref:glycine betaine ABC transporter substrate-binding protein n=1 Tax=Methylocystis silviterrae TaxID=2743612 RepID=UPI003C74A229